MDKFLVTGGWPLVGTIHVSGAKNSALPSMAAAILTTEDVVLENIPQVRDIDTERKLLAAMGAEVELWDDGEHATHQDQLRQFAGAGGQVRNREDDAGELAGAGAAGGAVRRGAGGHAGRVRDRRAAD